MQSGSSGATRVGGSTDISVPAVSWHSPEQCIHQAACAAEISITSIDFSRAYNINICCSTPNRRCENYYV